MNREIKIESVMTTAPRTIGDDQPLETVKHEMSQHGIRHLPVLRGGVCVGILSDRDVKLAFAVEPDRARSMTAADVFTDNAYSVSPHESVQAVARTLAERGIGSAVVQDKGKVVGIFMMTDACRVLAQVLTTPK